ncbi:PTS cellobiose transporter subunit IIA [Lactobacillus xylocopicola]|uniref:PTS cellobiose transporter subunit IIA n=1 Tax=Lactobacillus xylocopicola TaxID=2976676 RepID=A0ABN6SKG7_9LACO|nr:PTS cellobiose transporter subunit IIA [Lactobacillus xylocopicola]BDR60134.1 hypothetical protein KIM322_03950 [Lactobacillus xylocopicola]
MTDNKVKANEVERKKREDKIKYLYFSRYLMLRYIVTFFLFANLFWWLILIQDKVGVGMTVAGLMTVGAGAAAVEQLTKLHHRKLDVPVTRIYLWLQVAVNLFLSCLVVLPIRPWFFPFITTSNTAYVVLAILLSGIVLACVAEQRIHNILIGKDKYQQVIDIYQKEK